MAPFFYVPLTRSLSCAEQRLVTVVTGIVSFENDASDLHPKSRSCNHLLSLYRAALIGLTHQHSTTTEARSAPPPI